MSAVLNRPAEAEHCQFYPGGDCVRPATHEVRITIRGIWLPVCEPHAEMARELSGAETRALEGR